MQFCIKEKMITKKAILDAIHGKMIISCQAVEGEPLYVEEKSIMYLMARAAKQAGTPAIRTSSIRDVIAIKEETGLPVIGLVKIQYPGYEGYITPTMKEVDDLVAAGSDVVALDCTLRRRGDGITVNEFIAQIKEKYPDIILMADISNYEEGINAWKCGVDIVGTTMSGYTDYTSKKDEPDYELMERLARYRYSDYRRRQDSLSGSGCKSTTDRCMGDRGRRSDHTSAGNRTEISEGN